jgi:hypothetical protein
VLENELKIDKTEINLKVKETEILLKQKYEMKISEIKSDVH